MPRCLYCLDAHSQNADSPHRVCGAESNSELWKRRLPNSGKLGKRERTRFPLSHSAGGGCWG